MLNTGRQKNRGDTIVEALLALAIAAFAVGIAYATANRSLDQAITARERNQALNLIQNQITDLRIRYGGETAASFKTNFATPNHYCLDDTATTAGSVTPQWAPYTNFPSGGEDTTLQGGGSSPTSANPYKSTPSNACVRNIPGEATPFYIDIITTNKITVPSPVTGVNDTVFQVFVRWDRLGGGPINQASLYFRPNGNVN